MVYVRPLVLVRCVDGIRYIPLVFLRFGVIHHPSPPSILVSFRSPSSSPLNPPNALSVFLRTSSFHRTALSTFSFLWSFTSHFHHPSNPPALSQRKYSFSLCVDHCQFTVHTAYVLADWRSGGRVRCIYDASPTGII